ncbi:MAG: hypothetical protein IPG96_08335 [Proteobacteria bacterium]|nr:hypothetical protein [Pseudomonadota bacterium]
MEVRLGTNTFVDCGIVIGVAGTPLLQVATAPLRITMKTPAGSPSVPVDVTENVPQNGSVTVRHGDTSVSILYNDEIALCVAVEIEAETVLVRLDLRPIGINVYDDANGLHVGQNAFARNRIASAAVGLQLG